MRWTIKPATQAAFLELPGARLGAELVGGLLRLSLERDGKTESVDVACAGVPGELTVKLRLPKAPVVLIPVPPFVSLAESIVLIGAELPLDIAVELADGSSVWEFISGAYRKAWSGGLDGGEHSLAFEFSARWLEKPLDARAEEGRAGISILVANQARHRSEETRFVVPTRNLRLYALGKRLLSDGVAVVRDPEGGLRTSVRPLKSIAPEAPLLVIEEARESPQELFLRRGRRFLRSITGLENR